MSHARAQIRAAVIAALGTPAGITTVRKKRSGPIKSADLPLCEVSTPAETSDLDAMSPTQLARALTVVITVYYLAAVVDEDTADAAALAIESALGDELIVGGEPLQLKLTATAIELESESSSDAAAITLTYELFYDTDLDDPETITG